MILFLVDLKIPILGIIQSLFEASMYIFVFMWTPTLTVGTSNIDPPISIQFNSPIPSFYIFFRNHRTSSIWFNFRLLYDRYHVWQYHLLFTDQQNEKTS